MIIVHISHDPASPVLRNDANNVKKKKSDDRKITGTIENDRKITGTIENDRKITGTIEKLMPTIRDN